jgi:hypothetical protein
VIVFICVTKLTWILEEGQITILEKGECLIWASANGLNGSPGVTRRDDCMTTRFLLESCPGYDELAGNDVRGADWHSWTSLIIQSNLPFSITTNTIMKYNLIVCKVLTELVLARTSRH